MSRARTSLSDRCFYVRPVMQVLIHLFGTISRSVSTRKILRSPLPLLPLLLCGSSVLTFHRYACDKTLTTGKRSFKRHEMRLRNAKFIYLRLRRRGFICMKTYFLSQLFIDVSESFNRWSLLPSNNL